MPRVIFKFVDVCWEDCCELSPFLAIIGNMMGGLDRIIVLRNTIIILSSLEIRFTFSKENYKND